MLWISYYGMKTKEFFFLKKMLEDIFSSGLNEFFVISLMNLLCDPQPPHINCTLFSLQEVVQSTRTTPN
jgi:hypothetical protein